MRSRSRKLDEDKRAALVGAAMEEIAANGLDGASYNRIIERSGLSKGAVYYYFDNKESLYATVLEDLERKFFASVGRLTLPDTKGEFWKTCREYYEKSLRFAVTNLFIVKVVRKLVDPSADPGKTGQINESFRRMERWTNLLLRRGQSLGAFRKDVPLDLLREVLRAVGYTMDSWLFEKIEENPEDAPVEPFLTFALDMYKRILSPEGAEEAL